jgi:hypothetical protein
VLPGVSHCPIKHERKCLRLPQLPIDHYAMNIKRIAIFLFPPDMLVFIAYTENAKDFAVIHYFHQQSIPDISLYVRFIVTGPADIVIIFLKLDSLFK